MTVDQLIELLESFPGDAKVFGVFQPQWPMTAAITNVRDAGDDNPQEEGYKIRNVYLVLGGGLEDAPGGMFESEGMY